MTTMYWDIVCKPCQPTKTPPIEHEDSDDDSITERKERGTWASKAEFLLSCIGFAVGLGNVWRFPYKCYKNGGGAFLIPYFLCLAVCALPMVLMELSLGQFSSQSTIGVWRIAPIFRGIGWTMITVVTLVGIYYNIVISYILFYFFASFTSVLPWSSCDHWWNSDSCYVPGHVNQSLGYVNQSLDVNQTIMVNETLDDVNGTVSNVTSGLKSATEEFWERYVLQISSGIEEPGEMRWHLALLLFFSWIIIFLCLIKGVKSSGKVVYVTATFPYLVLFILLIRGVTLPGAGTGILYYITPRPEKLLDATVWFDAALQIFYSLCPGSGALIMLGSYNKFNNNSVRDGITVALLNCATSVLCGFVVFAVIGFMAQELGVTPDSVVTGGPGLAFVTFSTAISMMPAAPVWAVLFFLMLFTVGLDSQFVAIEVIISGITDVFPSVLRKYKELFTGIVCFVLFLLGLPMATQGGLYLLHLVDSYCAGIPLLICAFLECVIVHWVYGQKRFVEDVMYMTGSKPNLYLRLCWKYFCPLLIVAIFIFTLVMHAPLTYGSSYVFPDWSNSLGWTIVASSLILIPIFAVWEVVRHKEVKKIIKQSIQPDESWGPYLPENRDPWLQSQKDNKKVKHNPKILNSTQPISTPESKIEMEPLKVNGAAPLATPETGSSEVEPPEYQAVNLQTICEDEEE